MAKDDDDDDFAVDSVEPGTREDGQPGPPESWPFPSWYDRQQNDWWWDGKPDPCPVRFLGFDGGQYIVVSGAREVRRFTSGQLHGRGGTADVFGGSLWWPLKHFRKWNAETKENSGKLQERRLMSAIIRACRVAGRYDGSGPVRSVGTWRGPDGQPIVHAGERVFVAGKVQGPGLKLGDTLYVIGANREAPANVHAPGIGYDGYEWDPAPASAGHTVAAHLDEWHWQDLEARDLFQGGLYCDMLGDAIRWKPHKFIRARAGSGKTTLLRYARALLGGAAHPISRTFSKARLEEHFAHTACALLLEEAESDTDPNRIRQVFDLVLLLSDEGATGGRFKREIDLHGSITMVATLTEEWRATIRSRMAFLELRALRERSGHALLPETGLEAMTAAAAKLSPALRARAIARFDFFQETLLAVRARILELGGSPRDGDQLGHLLAGWWAMTQDEPIDADTLRDLERFKPYILAVSEAEDGADDPSECYNVLLGLSGSAWRGGEQLTVGQMIARAREDDGAAERRALLALGLRLVRRKGESWKQAWLAIANKHPGLDRLFQDYPQYRGPKRAQLLSDLKRMIGGQLHQLQASAAPIRFAGPQSRALLVPPELLPTVAEEGEQDE